MDLNSQLPNHEEAIKNQGIIQKKQYFQFRAQVFFLLVIRTPFSKTYYILCSEIMYYTIYCGRSRHQ